MICELVAPLKQWQDIPEVPVLGSSHPLLVRVGYVGEILVESISKCRIDLYEYSRECVINGENVFVLLSSH